MAASTRFWFFLSLVLLLLTISEARILNGGGLIEKAREILEETTRRHNMEEQSAHDVNRTSPGGPDPKHH